jgi:heptosyltransferase-2
VTCHLVVQTAFLGDAILSLPFLARLLEHEPTSQIVVVAAPAGAEIFKLALERGLRDHASRVTVITYDKRGADRGWRSLLRLGKQIRSHYQPQTAWLLQRSYRSGILAILSGATKRIGFSTGAADPLYTQLVARNWDNGQSEVEKNLDLLRDVYEAISPWNTQNATSLLKGPQFSQKSTLPRIAISPGSPWPTKRWPAAHITNLCQQLTRSGIEVVLLGDNQGAEICSQIQNNVQSPLLKNLSGQTTLKQWIDVIADSQAVLSGDSAAVHAASDLNVPVVALFGPTLPEFGFAPWRPNSVALGLTGLSCRPCGIHGGQKCPLGHHHCLEKLNPELVLPELLKRVDVSA